jgi:methionine sulfoxide reductase heme-binding subunit
VSSAVHHLSTLHSTQNKMKNIVYRTGAYEQLTNGWYNAVAMTKKFRYTPFQIIMHILGWLPLAKIIFDGFTHHLTINPIQEVEQRLGRNALYFLVASLACTPLNTLFGWKELIKRRRAIGLYAFMYASLHFTVFFAIDYGFDWNEFNRQIVEKPFILLGLSGGLILLALAITSFQWWMRKMGKSWQSLHRGVYIAAVVVILHYALAKKANLLTLSGDIVKPALFGLIVLILLFMRIPPIRRALAQLRQRIAAARILSSR